jgi:type IV secretion system protein VirB10
MLVVETGDPRLQALFGTIDPRSSGVRPVVRLPRKGLPPLLFAISAAAVGLVLFCALNERRTGKEQPAVAVGRQDRLPGAWQAPPPLAIPPLQEPIAPSLAPNRFSIPIEAYGAEPRIVMPRTSGAKAAMREVSQGRPAFDAAPLSSPRPQLRSSSGALLLIDRGGESGGGPGLPPVLGVSAGPSAAQELPATGRVHATSLANPTLTVPQGSLIPAVLETGFDSTRPSFARAVVSRDVHGFDGKTVLIPRGSRLIGESRSPVAEGQKRAVITWTRLILPDGTTINIDSPAADTLGRGGVKASVDTHLLARIGDTIGKTVLELGRAFVSRSGPLVLLDGGGSSQSHVLSRTIHVPTLRLAPGTSISVFVAHDLEFSTAGGQQ